MKGRALYAISFENGCNLFINASSLKDAVTKGLDSLLSCLPEDFDRSNLVGITQVRRCDDCCHMCGTMFEEKEGIHIVEVPAEPPNRGTRVCISCARRVAEAYDKEC